MICLNYWCDTPEKKQKFIDAMEQNEKMYQEELRKKYNPDDIFKNREKVKSEVKIDNENSLVPVEKEKWYEKIFRKIRNIFSKKS